MKKTHEIHFEKKEIMILFLATVFFINGITTMIGIFLILIIGYRIANSHHNKEKAKFVNTDFVN